MNPTRFDRISTFFAQRHRARHPAAQEATPAGAADAEHGPTMLFVQTFQSGTITPVAGANGRYTLTLEAGTGQTIYFSDRPDRIVGANPTPQFLEGLGFLDDNPPNAALVVETAPGETDVAVVELFNPLYDPVSRGVTYEVEVLANWQDELEMGFHEAPTDLAVLAPSFGSAQLFIDDCPDMTMTCYTHAGFTNVAHGTIDNSEHNGFCYSYGWAGCYPCYPWSPAVGVDVLWADHCNLRFPDCQGECFAWPLCSKGFLYDCDHV